jgi:hypothetical protein
MTGQFAASYKHIFPAAAMPGNNPAVEGSLKLEVELHA